MLSPGEKRLLLDALVAEDATTTIADYLDVLREIEAVRPRGTIAERVQEIIGAAEVVRPKYILEFTWPGALKSTG